MWKPGLIPGPQVVNNWSKRRFTNMGTLFDQKPRWWLEVEDKLLESSLSTAIQLAKKYKVSPSDVIALIQALELRRRNNLFIHNGDAWDEQIGGLGEIFQRLTEAVEGLRDEFTNWLYDQSHVGSRAEGDWREAQ
jgi:hypothetical protein